MKKKNVVILGGGITGLYLACCLTQEKGYHVTILERNNHVGGICASFEKDGITFDYGPHKIYTTIPGVLDKYKNLLGNDLLTIKKKNSLRLLGKYFEFPVKMQQMVLGIPFFTGLRCGMSYGFALLKKLITKNSVTYEDYLLQGFGKVGYDLLFKDYAWKVWGNPQTLSEELARKRIPVPSIFSLLKNMIKKQDPSVSADYFYYPRKGFGQLTEILRKKILASGGKIILEAQATGIRAKGKSVESVSYEHHKRKKTIPADLVVSTIHITDIPSLFPLVPEHVTRAASQLHHRGLILVYLVVQKERLFQENWLFFPEKEYIFNRVSEQKSFSTETMPQDKSVIIAEVTATPDDKRWSMSEKMLIDLVIADLKKADILHGEIILDAFTRRARRIYPIYAIGYKAHLQTILDFIHTYNNLYTLGRQGLFNYNNTDHCIDMGRKMVDHLLQNKTKEEWQKTIAYFDSYRIVD